MKKSKLHLIVMGCLMVASLFVACKKENNNDDNNESTVFTANTEGGEDGSKTYLIDTKIYWMKGDSIRIINAANQSHIFYLTEGKNTQVGRFSTSETFSKTPPYYALYPGGNLTTQGIATFTVGQIQDIGIDTGTFANDFMPMVAHSNTNKLYFKNVFGGLCFKLTGDRHVSRIVLTSNDANEKLWGTFTVDCNSDNPLPTYVSGGNNRVELTCDITLTTGEQEFIIMMPPGTMATGFNMTAYDGNTVIYDKTSNTNTAIIERTMIKSLSTAISITIPYHNVSVSANPTAGGSAYIGTAGTFSVDYQEGTSCTVTAVANPNYTFSNWTENGQVVSTQANYTFNVDGDHNLVANFTPINYTISVLANPTAGGSVSGGGSYAPNTTVTLTATPNAGYIFTGWSDGNTSNPRQITVTGNATYTANFTQAYTVTVISNNSSWGSVSGGGTYAPNATCTVTATPISGYICESWTIGGSAVKYNSTSYTFTVTSDVTIQANFVAVPENAIPGLFYVDRWVWFSKGNVQYNNGTTWRFATNQYDRIGNNGQYGDENSGRARDVFAWSMNGQKHKGNDYTIYMPYQYGYAALGGTWNGWYPNACFAYASGVNCPNYFDLNSSNGSADWGYNFGSSWRTLTVSEWNSLINNHTKGWSTVAGVPGYVIRPYGNTDAIASSYTAAAWATEEAKGTLFLPAAGIRDLPTGTWYSYNSQNECRLYGSTPTVTNYGTWGYYWSATHQSSDWHQACYMYFNSGGITTGSTLRNHGCSVRLAKNR